MIIYRKRKGIFTPGSIHTDVYFCASNAISASALTQADLQACSDQTTTAHLYLMGNPGSGLLIDLPIFRRVRNRDENS